MTIEEDGQTPEPVEELDVAIATLDRYLKEREQGGGQS